MPSVLCFGETLWDILPTGPVPGGAPMNVALHLHQRGTPVHILSRVGQDDYGARLRAYLSERGLPLDGLQTDPQQPTGTVTVNDEDVSEISYEIHQPVAWDHIEADHTAQTLVREADWLVFGSLAARSAGTRATLQQLLPLARGKVFDVNFRPPHYGQDSVLPLLRAADLVKTNHHELAEIAGWLGLAGDLVTQAQGLRREMDLRGLIVTRGAQGALFCDAEGWYDFPGYRVTVADTIGSGDAFLAGFLHQYLQGAAPVAALDYGCALGALVASRAGANPVLTEEQISDFRGKA
ncbi:MAG: carbohydrate kinase [Bacteroidetes bacterium]|nr:MAG: carbohydrate kinase [Bacteroidota bacterium]